VAIRTTTEAVEGVLGDDYDRDGGRDLTPFVETASAMVDTLVVKAALKAVTFTAARLELIERWLAAHYYTQSDRTYKSRSTLDASATFNTDGKEYLNAALALDNSGCLAALLNGKRAGAFWLGKAPSEQIAHWDRD
jgi:hypothetical protein